MTSATNNPKVAQKRFHRVWLWGGGLAVGITVIVGIILLSTSRPVSAEAPEAKKVLDVQARMPFQILIPAYLPKPFDRSKADISVEQVGPGGEPMVQIAYRTRRDATVFVRQWVPGNPTSETLAGSKPIQTKWGKGFLLTHGASSLATLWVDVGPLRVAVYSNDLNAITREQMLEMANTLGPASNRQVFSFSVERPVIKDVPPPPPFEVPLNAQGVQEFTLVITPGGYSPLRFAVRRGIPVKMTFKQLGQVGCGNELVLPTSARSGSSLKLENPQDTKVLEFTPAEVGEFQFYCGHFMYRGVMTVRE